MDPSDFDPKIELIDLERRLTRWQPAAAGLNRDQLMYEAGRAADRADARVPASRLAAAAFALVAAGLGTMLILERGERHALETQVARLSPSPSRVASVIESPTPEVVVQAPAPESYLVLTHHWPRVDLDDLFMDRPVTPSREGSPDSEPPLRVRNRGGTLKF